MGTVVRRQAMPMPAVRVACCTVQFHAAVACLPPFIAMKKSGKNFAAQRQDI
jgi:hypothetical protein